MYGVVATDTYAKLAFFDQQGPVFRHYQYMLRNERAIQVHLR